MLVQIVSIVFPVFTVIAIGYLYGRKHRPDMIATNQVNMGIFVPALIFSALAGKSVDLAEVQIIAFGGLVIVLGSGLLGWPIARRLGYEAKTLLPPMMFKNAGNMGLPLLLFAFGEQALPAAVVLFLVENVLHFAIITWWLGHNAKLWRLLRETDILLVFGALPPAVLNFMFAELYRQEPERWRRS
jgi:predicted permease